jgi:hypothetical protein
VRRAIRDTEHCWGTGLSQIATPSPLELLPNGARKSVIFPPSSATATIGLRGLYGSF